MTMRMTQDRRDAKIERLSFSSRAAALVFRISQLGHSMLTRVCTPFTKSEEKVDLFFLLTSLA